MLRDAKKHESKLYNSAQVYHSLLHRRRRFVVVKADIVTKELLCGAEAALQPRCSINTAFLARLRTRWISDWLLLLDFTRIVLDGYFALDDAGQMDDKRQR